MKVVDWAGVEQRTGAQRFRCNYDMKNAKVTNHMNPFFYLNLAVSENVELGVSPDNDF